MSYSDHNPNKLPAKSANTPLDEVLKKLGLSDSVFYQDPQKQKVFKHFSSEIARKLDIIQPNAFFVFNNQPYILFFDLTENRNADREDTIHKQVWSFDQAPLVFIIKDRDVEVYNAFSFDKKLKRLEKIDNKQLEQFSFWNIQSGKSWEWLESHYYKKSNTNKRANQKLFENIKDVREGLVKHGISEEDASILILRLIFIRYLIDRDVKLDKSFITGISVLERRASFSQLIAKPRKLDLFFGKLNEKFNGVLFKNTRIKLTDIQSLSLCKVFDGNTGGVATIFDNDLEFYFGVFDFSIIPVELISGIYESLINKETRNKNSAIYTPSFLVEYILTETVDKFLKEKGTSECKVYDPSCGSGIFLVQAFRRMVQKEKELHGNKINKTRLREIAENNLFGTDISEQAINVTCFSIYIALLDYQEPATLMNSFLFPHFVGKNFFGGETANFFNADHEYNQKIKSVDFILGNPPWKSINTDSYHTNYLKRTSLNGIRLNKIVGDKQIAQSFILRTLDFCKSNPKCALIVTSKAIYNDGAKYFKNAFLETFHLTKCYDFSAVRGLIFNDAANPPMILFYEHASDKSTHHNLVKHVSIKSNVFLRHYRSLVIEKADVKEIQQQYFIKHSWMFKVALYGGTLDYVLLKKLTSNEIKLSSLIDNKTVFSGDGIKLWTETAKKKEIDRAEKSGKNKVFKDFTEIRKIPIIETEQILENYTEVNPKNLPTKSDMSVKSGNNISLYRGHRIIFKARPRDESDIVVSYIDCDSVYREKTLGISTKRDYDILKLIFAYTASNLYTYFEFLTSSGWGTYLPEILQKEYLAFPFIEPTSSVKSKLVNLADDFINSYKEYRKGILRLKPSALKVNSLINAIYSIKGYELDLIDYVLNVSRYQFQESKEQQQKFIRNPSPKELEDYVDVYIKEFEKIYDDEHMYVDIFKLNHFVAMKFSFQREKLQNKKQIQEAEETDEGKVLKYLSNLTMSQITDAEDPEKNLYIQKDIKGFEKDSFYIIKPNEYKSWHRAMAWYDVAEFKEAIQKAELEYMNENQDS